MPKINIDLSGVEASSEFKSIPTGVYPMVIVDSDYLPTNAGTGYYLKLKIQCLDEQIGKRVLFENLNLDNPNDTAVQIAKATLKEIAQAVGHATPDQIGNSEELHDVPMLVSVVRKKAKENRKQFADSDGFENEIRGFKAISAAAGEGSGAGVAPPPAASDVPF
jgi:predicted RNA-binding protein YlxR (DUF448 family)